MSLSERDATEFAALRTLSARVGADPRLVQGPGGNTSLKADGLLWIKASGTWLMHAARDEMFVPVSIAPLLEAVADGAPEAETAQVFVPEGMNPAGLRPSIETTVHALMPQRIVVHVHCVETIASAVEVGCEERLAGKLAGLDWVFIPYRRPGLPLAREIAARRRPETDVLVLGNHGLVVAADTVEAATALLAEVSRRLARPARPLPPGDPAALARLAGANWRPAADPAAHAAATDPASLAIAARGSLYPDHVIFLGPEAPVAGDGEDADAVTARLEAAGIEPPPWILVPGLGVLVRRDASSGAEPMARCLADVAARIPAGADLNWLTDTDVAALTDWDAEKYRQALARRAADAS